MHLKDLKSINQGGWRTRSKQRRGIVSVLTFLQKFSLYMIQDLSSACSCTKIKYHDKSRTAAQTLKKQKSGRSFMLSLQMITVYSLGSELTAH